jgi:hypothetical protein
MTNIILTIVSGMGILIFIYLLLAKGDKVPDLISNTGKQIAQIVSTLQGN